jgi:hypothetical protein
MKHRAQHALLALLATIFVVFATGCETLHSPLLMEPLENYGGGGGDPS